MMYVLSLEGCGQHVHAVAMCATCLRAGERVPIATGYVRVVVQSQRLPHQPTDADPGDDCLSILGHTAANADSTVDRNGVSLSELLQRGKDGATTRVNVTAGPGYGKTTLCQHIVSQWVHRSLLCHYDLVVFVPLPHLNSGRYPSGDVYTVVDVIITECLHRPLDPMLRQLVRSHYSPDATFFVLDGYDEVVGRTPAHLVELLGQLLAMPHRLLTGRPAAMQGVACDTSATVVGYGDREVAGFVKQFVAAHGDTVRPNRSHDDVLSSLADNSVMWAAAHVPINLVLLCHVLLEDDGSGGVGVTGRDFTHTQLYGAVVALMMRRYCRRLGLDMERLTGDAVTGACRGHDCTSYS